MGESWKPTHETAARAAQADLRLEEFFDGDLVAEGEFRDPFGRVRRTFHAVVTGTRDGNTLRLRERFFYNDGETDTREWMIEALGDGRYRGTASDVIGRAEGRVENGTLRWSYPIDLPIGGRAWRLHFDDEFTLVRPGALRNTANVSKFGLPIGRVVQTFARKERAAG